MLGLSSEYSDNRERLDEEKSDSNSESSYCNSFEECAKLKPEIAPEMSGLAMRQEEKAVSPLHYYTSSERNRRQADVDRLTAVRGRLFGG